MEKMLRTKRVEGSRVARLRALRWLIATALAAGCGGMTGGAKTGGESHFLEYCASSCAAGLDCISGVCTRGCLVGDEACGDLAELATCTDQSVEPGAVAVCDVGCESDDQYCAGLGENYRCVDGFCRGGTPPGSTELSCRVAYREYPSGSTDVPSGTDCSTCRCEDGELVDCTLADCQTDGSIRPCPDTIRSDSFDLVDSYVSGHVLTLEISHSGGCARHDYELCYEMQTFPNGDVEKRTPFHFIHDAHGDTCEAYLQRQLTFDLRPYSSGGFDEFAPPFAEDTGFGTYNIGRFSCEESTVIAAEQMSEASAALSGECDSDADCTLLSIDTECSAGCGVLAAVGDEIEVFRARTNINEGICRNYAADGCTTKVIPPCVPPPPIACINNKCAYATGE